MLTDIFAGPKVVRRNKDEINQTTEDNTPQEIPIMIEALKKMYKNKLLPFEQRYNFQDFASPSLKDAYFDSKPFVLLIGQYSVGKTTFIRYLLERDFPGVRIGPEPTTDRFMVLMHGPTDRTIPGNALCADISKPFTQLTKFGMGFLNKFECAECKSPILDKVSFIDTPGILSGEKQRTGRGYDFPTMCEWFAGRCDRILLLFDANKLDISDEMSATIEQLRDNDDKIRVVLNKSDIPTQQLVRVYGALMWSLGKVFQTPEVLRVYVGSFWDEPLQNKENEHLLELEEKDLLSDLRTLPRNVAVRKVNELIKRARKAKIHALIVLHLKEQFGVFGKGKKQAKLLENLGDEFKKIMDKEQVPKNDFPNIKRFRECLKKFEIHKFPKMKKDLLTNLEQMLSVEMPKLMSMVPSEADETNGDMKKDNPFAYHEDTKEQGLKWIIDGPTLEEYTLLFGDLPLTGGKVSGKNVKELMTQSGLPSSVLGAIWSIADMDVDGWLDNHEFAVALYLVNSIKDKSLSPEELPSPEEIPIRLIPPSKRYLFKPKD